MLTLDTGALTALERRSARAIRLLQLARTERASVTVPVPVVVEWWRGQRGPARRLLDSFDVEPLDELLARVAGEALAKTPSGPSPVDAVVMASAARRGDRVITSDVPDLERLRAVFPMVRLLGV